MWVAAKLRVLQWNRLARSPELLQRTQWSTLQKLLQTASATEFGRAHSFDRIRAYPDFQERVPLRTYAGFEPYLVRMRRGEKNVLWPGLIPFYGQSSGSSQTAAIHKFLPVSHEQIRWQQKAGFDVVARYLDLTGDRRLTGGYFLGLFPPGTIRQEGPVGIGTNPGLMQRHLPPLARLIALPRPGIRDIHDYDQKLTAIAESYLDYDVRAISGTTCWFSILFDRVLAAARARGRSLNSVSQIWPNLRVLFGGGVYAEPYRQIIDDRFGKPLVLMDNYNATEGGLFSVTDRLDDSGMLMIPDRGVFYEFVPLAQHGRPDAVRVPIWEVEPGVDYSVVLSTSSGLFAYFIGDLVRFVSIFPHRMEFAGRTSGMLSVTQELTSYLEIERAVTAAVREQTCSVVDFAASSEVGVDGTAKGRYIVFAEFDRAPADLASFATIVDRELCAQNRVYREHRAKDVAILPPVVIPLAKGMTRSFMEALGQTSVQNKFPRIIDERRRDILRSLARENAVEGRGAP